MIHDSTLLPRPAALVSGPTVTPRPPHLRDDLRPAYRHLLTPAYCWANHLLIITYPIPKMNHQENMQQK